MRARLPRFPTHTAELWHPAKPPFNADRDDRPDAGERHVLLRIPGIALSAQIRRACRWIDDRGCEPLQDLVERAKTRDCGEEHERFGTTAYRHASQQELTQGPQDQEAEREVDDPVIMIA
jgi:hypothetical protein